MIAQDLEIESDKLNLVKTIFPDFSDDVIIDALASNKWNVEIAVQVLLTITEHRLVPESEFPDLGSSMNNQSVPCPEPAPILPQPLSSMQVYAGTRHGRQQGPKGKKGDRTGSSNNRRQSPSASFVPGHSFELGMRFLREHLKALILMRGVPGSGKSTLARKLAELHDGVCYSTDDFHYDENGVYSFKPENLFEAHGKNQRRAMFAMEAGISPVIIDNTNIELWETKPYAVSACKYGYDIAVLEPDTPWRYDPRICGQKNTHGVSKTKISSMIEKLKRNQITASQVTAYGHSFSTSVGPSSVVTPGSDRKQAMPEEVPHQEPKEPVSKAHGSTVTTESACSGVPYEALPQRASADRRSSLSENTLVEDAMAKLDTVKIDWKEEWSVERGFSNQMAGGIKSRSNTFGSSDQSSDCDGAFCSPDDPERPKEARNRRRLQLAAKFDFENASPLKGTSMLFSGPPPVYGVKGESEMATPEISSSWNDFVNLPVVPLETVASTGTGKGAPVSSVSNDSQRTFAQNVARGETSSAVETFLDVNLNFGSLDWQNLGDAHQFSERDGSAPKLASMKSVETSEVGVQTNFSDKSCLRILLAHPRDIGPILPSSFRKSGTAMLDKGVCTDDNEAEGNASVKVLLKMFPTASVDALQDVLENCQDDLDWAVNVLLDSEYEMVPLGDYDPCVDLETKKEPSTEQNEEEKSQDERLVSPEMLADAGEGVAADSDIHDLAKRPATPSNAEDHMKLRSQIEDMFVLSPSVSDHARRITGKGYQGFKAYEIRLRKGLEQPPTPSAPPRESPLPPSEHSTGQDGSAGFYSPDPSEGARSPQPPDEEMVPMTLTPEFANKLTKMFLHPGSTSERKGSMDFEPDQLKMLIPRSVALEIFSYWWTSLFCKQQNQEDGQTPFVVPAEPFIGNSWRGESNLQEIMDMELGLHILEQEKTNSEEMRALKNSLAVKLKEKILHDNFPHVDPTYLDAVYEAHSYNYENSVQILEKLTEVSAKRPNTSIRVPNQPALIEQQEEELDPSTMSVKDARENAQYHTVRRHSYLTMADQAQRKGMSAVASYYTQEARFHAESSKDYNAIATELLSQTARVQNEPGYTIDLHFLYVPEALKVLDRHIKKVRDGASSQRGQGGCIQVITGRGLRSINGVSRLRPAVEAYLRQKKMRFEELNPGMLKIYLR